MTKTKLTIGDTLDVAFVRERWTQICHALGVTLGVLRLWFMWSIYVLMDRNIFSGCSGSLPTGSNGTHGSPNRSISPSIVTKISIYNAYRMHPFLYRKYDNCIYRCMIRFCQLPIASAGSVSALHPVEWKGRDPRASPLVSGNYLPRRPLWPPGSRAAL